MGSYCVKLPFSSKTSNKVVSHICDKPRLNFAVKGSKTITLDVRLHISWILLVPSHTVAQHMNLCRVYPPLRKRYFPAFGEFLGIPRNKFLGILTKFLGIPRFISQGQSIRSHGFNKPPSQSCAEAKSKKFWKATGQSNLVDSEACSIGHSAVKSDYKNQLWKLLLCGVAVNLYWRVKDNLRYCTRLWTGLFPSGTQFKAVMNSEKKSWDEYTLQYMQFFISQQKSSG